MFSRSLEITRFFLQQSRDVCSRATALKHRSVLLQWDIRPQTGGLEQNTTAGSHIHCFTDLKIRCVLIKMRSLYLFNGYGRSLQCQRRVVVTFRTEEIHRFFCNFTRCFFYFKVTGTGSCFTDVPQH